MAAPWPLAAHHGSSITQLSADRALVPASWSWAQPRPQLRLGLDYSVTHFGGLKQGRRDFSTPDAGSITLQAWRWHSSLTLASDTHLRLVLPVGHIRVRGTASASRRRAGLGDVHTGVLQGLLQAWNIDPAQAWLGLSLGLDWPTGEQNTDAAVSLSALESDPSGALDLVTYDTRASLGTGSYALTHGLQGHGRLHPYLTLDWALFGRVPLHETSDNIRWGLDVNSSFGLRAPLHAGRLEPGLHLDHQWHGPDRIPDEEAPAARVRIGRRHDLGLRLSLAVRWQTRWRCDGGIRLPLWQWAGAVQWVQNVAGHLGCGVSLGP